MCPIGLVLKIYTSMNEVQIPVASILSIFSICSKQNSGAPKSHISKHKMHHCIVPTCSNSANTHSGCQQMQRNPHAKNLHQKICKCHEILLCLQNIYYDKINKSLLWSISKKLSFLKGACFPWQPQKPLKIFRLPVLKGIRFMAISEKQNSVTQYITYLMNKTQEHIIPGSQSIQLKIILLFQQRQRDLPEKQLFIQGEGAYLNTDTYWNPWEHFSYRKRVFPTLVLLLMSWTRF